MKRKIFKTAKGFVNAVNRNKFEVIVITPYVSMTFESRVNAQILQREDGSAFISIHDENHNRIFVDILDNNVDDLTTYKSAGSSFYIHITK